MTKNQKTFVWVLVILGGYSCLAAIGRNETNNEKQVNVKVKKERKKEKTYQFGHLRHVYPYPTDGKFLWDERKYIVRNSQNFSSTNELVKAIEQKKVRRFDMEDWQKPWKAANGLYIVLTDILDQIDYETGQEYIENPIVYANFLKTKENPNLYFRMHFSGRHRTELREQVRSGDRLTVACGVQNITIKYSTEGVTGLVVLDDCFLLEVETFRQN
jgi:hypothetical protein